MRQSELFTKSERAFPKDEVSLNAKLLTRAGYIRKLSAGIYAYLPLGLRVIQNIARVIREEMDAVGGQELFLSALVPKKYLEATGRADLEVGFEVRGKGDERANFILGWSHEDVLTALASKFVESYKDLPFAAYQIQTKFRNEARPQSGLLRGREFLMKDLYSFHASEDDLYRYYDEVKRAYERIFSRLGLTTVYTLAAGGDFTINNTHEFQVVADVGEDTIFVCEACGYAENAEISKLENGDKCPKCEGKVKSARAIEVGNIFPLGTRYSEPLGLLYTGEDGKKKPVVMGSYGIGIGRVMGTITEIMSDEKGLVWPETVAPFRVHLLELGGASAEKLYNDLQKANVTVLYDDRDISAGEKLNDADLLGIPWRAVVSPKTGDKVELKKRSEKEAHMIEAGVFLERMSRGEKRENI
ncbi:MAG: aminoacyl--tRNA ligase-related protein [Patescibacteria group bacterium]